MPRRTATPSHSYYAGLQKPAVTFHLASQLLDSGRQPAFSRSPYGKTEAKDAWPDSRLA